MLGLLSLTDSQFNAAKVIITPAEPELTMSMDYRLEVAKMNNNRTPSKSWNDYVRPANGGD